MTVDGDADIEAEDDYKNRSRFTQTLRRLEYCFILRETMEVLNLSHCKLGDTACQVIFESLVLKTYVRTNFEQLSLDLSSNLITNASIKHLMRMLDCGELSCDSARSNRSSESAKSQSSSDSEQQIASAVSPNVMKPVNDAARVVNPHKVNILRLKSLNLSNNELYSEVPELTKKESTLLLEWPAGRERYQVKQIMMHDKYKRSSCPLRSMIVLLYRQIFLQELNLAGN